MTWLEFSEELCGRFGEKSVADVVEEFNKLRLEGLVEDYLKRFEELMALIWMAQPSLTEPYFVSSFFSGWKDELRSMVKMMMPSSVKQAAENTRLQELTLKAIVKKNKVWTQPSKGQNPQFGDNFKAVTWGAGQGGAKNAMGQGANKNQTMERSTVRGINAGG